MRSRLFVAGIGVACLSAVVMATSGAFFDDREDRPPGGIRLLRGYKHETLQGIDSRVGRISRKDGVTIEYDIGPLAGNYATSILNDDRAWSREQTVASDTVQIVMTKKNVLHVSFKKGPANFWATAVTPADVADVLLMALTYPTAEKP